MKFRQIHNEIWTNTIHSTRYSHRHGHPVTGASRYTGRSTNIFWNLDKYIFQFGQIHFTAPITGTDTRLLGRVGTRGGGQICLAIRTNTFFNLDKYLSIAIWTNIFHSTRHRHRHPVTGASRYTRRRTDIFWNLDKYILQFVQIHFSIWTNTFHSTRHRHGHPVTGASRYTRRRTGVRRRADTAVVSPLRLHPTYASSLESTARV